MPPLPPGLAYVQIAAGAQHSLAVRNDGMLVAWGANGSGQALVPALPPGIAYMQAAGGERHTVALRSDGSVAAFGANNAGQLNIPPLPAGVFYLQVAAGGDTSAALRSDGQIAVWGSNASGQFNVPPLPPGIVYVQVDAGGTLQCPALGTTCSSIGHLVAVRSDGAAVAWGSNSNGQATVPPAPPGAFYMQAAAGALHSLFLLSDGTIAGAGSNSAGQALGAPPPPFGLPYIQVAAGLNHSLALRIDGQVAAWGLSAQGQTSTPAPPPGLAFAGIAGGGGHSLFLIGQGAQASVTAFGGGCGGSLGAPVLSSTQVPFIGNSAFTLDVAGATPNSLAYLFFAAGPAATPYPAGGGCFIHLDLTSFATFINLGLSPMGPLPTGPAGATSFNLPVPGDPQAAGISLAFQAAVADGTAPLGLALTNGVVGVIY